MPVKKPTTMPSKILAGIPVVLIKILGLISIICQAFLSMQNPINRAINS
jgi:hypothetical protein